MSALQNPPRATDALRGWLATVMRRISLNRRRGDIRRHERERTTARPDRMDSAALLAERRFVEQGILKAVLELEEPYRTTILLRYYEDLPPTQMAEELGISENTVRSRLRRAHAQLRGRLDRAYGRPRWSVALAALLPASERGMRRAAQGAAVTASAAAVIGLLVAAGAVGWLLSGRDAIPGALPLPHRTSIEEAASIEEPAEPITVKSLASTRLTVTVDVRDAPSDAVAAKATVVAETVDGMRRIVRRTQTDENGRAVLTFPRDAIAERTHLHVAAFAPNRRPSRAIVPFPLDEPEGDRATQRLQVPLTLTAGVPWQTRVVSIDGRAMAGVQVELTRAGFMRDPDAINRAGQGDEEPGVVDAWLRPRCAVTDAAGVAKFRGLRPGTWQVRAGRRGYWFKVPDAVNVLEVDAREDDDDATYLLGQVLQVAVVAPRVGRDGRIAGPPDLGFALERRLASRGGHGLVRVRPLHHPLIAPGGHVLYFAADLPGYTGWASELEADIESWRTEFVPGPRPAELRVVRPGVASHPAHLVATAWADDLLPPAQPILLPDAGLVDVRIGAPFLAPEQRPCRLRVVIENGDHRTFTHLDFPDRGDAMRPLPPGLWTLRPSGNAADVAVPFEPATFDVSRYGARVNLTLPPGQRRVRINVHRPLAAQSRPAWVHLHGDRGDRVDVWALGGSATFWTAPGRHPLTVMIGGHRAERRMMLVPERGRDVVEMDVHLDVDW